MSELVQEFSWLQLIWGSRIALHGSLILYFLVSGSFWDLAQGDKEPGGKIGWFEFRKRIIAQYTLATGWTGWILWQAGSIFFLDHAPSGRLQYLLDLAATPKQTSTDATCVLLGGGLFFLHFLRHMQESMRISIFSMRQTMGVIHTVIVHGLQLAAGLTLLAEAPALQAQEGGFQVSSLMNWKVPVGLALYFFGSKIQHQCSKILAQLRRNRAGHIVTTGYKIPKGGWFDTVSSPHYFGEICIYAGIGMVMGMSNTTWWLMTGSVGFSVLTRALSKHRLYQKKFDDYPRDRKMLIPYIL